MDTPTCKNCQYAPALVLAGIKTVCWARDNDDIAFPERPGCDMYRRAEYGGQLREIAADALKTIAELKEILELPPEAGNNELILAVMRRL